jgi:serine/threonine-protein kinase
MGRYLAVVSRHGYTQTRIPLCVRRQEHVSHTPPGHAAPRPIRLLRPDELGEDDVYVPCGWFWSGTDDASVRGRLPRRHLWADAFVIRRFPVTNAEYITWLDALVARGEEEEALARAPRYPGRDASPGALIYGRRPDGGFCLIRDNAGDLWEPDAPVLMVRWEDAAAFCAWEAARTGLPWRLPLDLEREKAARGADGRRYPWGEVLDPSFTAMRLSHAGPPQPAPVSAYPTDESPYGVRGLAGNAMDWCQDVFRPEGPPVSPEGLALPDPVSDGPSRVCRGGGWFFVAGDCRAEVRWQVPPRTRREDCSFRLCRSI